MNEPRSRWDQPPPSRRRLKVYLAALFVVPGILVVGLVMALVNQNWYSALALLGLLAFYAWLRSMQLPEALRLLREQSRTDLQ